MTQNITYSELVYLLADKLVSERARLFNVDSHFSQEKIATKPLSQLIVTAALAQLVNDGYLKLEVKDVKKLLFFPGKAVFGSRLKKELTQSGSIEYKLWENFFKEIKVADGVYNLLSEDVASPWSAIVTLVKESLVTKGLLTKQKGKTIFSLATYALVTNRVNEWQDKLSSIQTEIEKIYVNAEMKKLIITAVDKGVASRKEQPEGSDLD